MSSLLGLAPLTGKATWQWRETQTGVGFTATVRDRRGDIVWSCLHLHALTRSLVYKADDAKFCAHQAIEADTLRFLKGE